MKIADRGGHTQTSPGACGVLNELTEDRKLYKRVQDLLSEVGNTMIDCTPPESYAYPAELTYGINKCNNSNAQLFYSIHLNSASGAKGSEICVYPNTPLCNTLGTNILSNLANLGFVNRGLKPRTDLGELTNINCPSMIIEVCFVQSPDAELYKSLGVERIARAIANGIDSRVSLEVPISKPNIEMHRNIVIYNDCAEADKWCAEFFKMILKNANEDCECVSYSEYRKSLIDGRSIFAVGGSLKDKFRYHKLFSGIGRNETAQSVLEHLKKY